MTDMAGVQEVYKQLLQQATVQFNDSIQEATKQMEAMIKEASNPPAPVAKAEARDGGLWLNDVAVSQLLDALAGISEVLEKMQDEVGGEKQK